MSRSVQCWRFHAALQRGISLLLLSLGVVSLATAQESASFKMKRMTVAALAKRLVSTSYRNTVIALEVVGVSGVCPSGAATHLGFWSVLGATEVPIVLRVDKTPSSVELSWTDALADANTLSDGTCGLADGSADGAWRLPNVKELQSLIDFGIVNPALPTGYPFSGADSISSWSSTTPVDAPMFAWLVDFYNGFTFGFDKDDIGYVWPVRGGQ